MLTFIRYITLVLIFVGVCLGFNQYNKPMFRYSYDPCPRKLIFDRKDDVDFLVTGGSRMMMAFRTDEFSKALSKNTPRIAYDLSRSWRSEFHTYIFLRDFYNQGRKVNNLIILFYEASDLKYHPHAHILGTVPDVYELVNWDDRLTWTEKTKDNLFLNIQRAAYHLEKWMKGELHKESGDVKSMTDKTTDCSFNETTTKALYVVDKNEKKAMTTIEWDLLDEDRNARPEAFIKKTIELASKHNTQVYLVLPPAFMRKALSREFIKKVEDIYQVPFLSPDQKTFDTFNTIRFYADESHMTPDGAAIFSKWLAGEILKHEEHRK